MHERAPVKPTFAALKPIYGGALMQVSFECELKGSGAAGTAPEIGPLLRACGLTETVVPATSVAYTPDSSPPHASVYFYYYQDGVLHKIGGCRGSAQINAQAGGPGKVAFTFTGHYNGQTDTALPAPTYNSAVPVPYLGAAFTVDAYGAVISKLALDLGVTLAMPDSVTAADGFGEILITGRRVKGSLDPHAVTKATKDFIDKWQTNAAMALASGTVGTTAGNRWALSLPAITATELAKGAVNGITTYELGFMAAESGGVDNEFSLTFT
jgi:hypothetical protein